jgi:hypothetical protein
MVLVQAWIIDENLVGHGAGQSCKKSEASKSRCTAWAIHGHALQQGGNEKRETRGGVSSGTEPRTVHETIELVQCAKMPNVG